MWQSALETAKSPSKLEIIILCDDDDPTLDEYKKIFSPDTSDQLKFIIEKRNPNLPAAYNEIYRRSSADIVMIGSDDLIFESPGWDEKVVKAFDSVPDKIAFVFPLLDLVTGPIHDGIWDPEKKFGAFFFLHKNWVETIGYFFPPYIGWSDVWLNDVGDRINRRFILEDVSLKHMHWEHCPSVERDQTYRENIERKFKYNVPEIYKNTENKRIKDAEKLQGFIDEYAKKHIINNTETLIERTKLSNPNINISLKETSPRASLKETSPRASLREFRHGNHIPILRAIEKIKTIKRVVEFGCGEYSTKTFLDRKHFPALKLLASYETDITWYSKIGSKFEDQRFVLHFIPDSLSALPRLPDNSFDLMFVDGLHEHRQYIVENLSNVAPLCVLHDSDCYPISPDIYKYRWTYTPPYPNRSNVQILSETTVLSKSIDVSLLASHVIWEEDYFNWPETHSSF